VRIFHSILYKIVAIVGMEQIFVDENERSLARSLELQLLDLIKILFGWGPFYIPWGHTLDNGV
jgi:hypothetical protein